MHRCLLVLMLSPLPAWACSGPGAGEAIRQNTLAALALFLAAGVATVFTVLRQKRLGRTRKSAAWLVAPTIGPYSTRSRTSGRCAGAASPNRYAATHSRRTTEPSLLSYPASATSARCVR